ncbi:MAG: two-component regulator propeller domain-containing protein [Bacteroidales bacterium]
MRIRLFYIAILFLLFYNAFAQPVIIPDPYKKFDQLTKRDGLSNNYILDIHQDKSGFIWIATKDGLNRYDGYGFKTFNHDPYDSLSISDNLITCIKSDNEGVMWVGTKNGLNKFNAHKGNFNRYYFSDSIHHQKGADYIRAILPDDSVTVWIETADGKLHKFNPLELHSQKYSHDMPGMIDTYFYHTIFKDRNNDLWLGGRYMGIYKFDVDSSTFSFYRENPDDATKKRDNDVSAYFEDSQGTFWISGIDGLYTFDTENELFEKILPVSTFGIQEDKNEKLWLATGNGVYLFDKAENVLYHLRHNDNSPASLVNDHVNKVFIDRNQNVWLGTTDGISIYKPSKNKFGQIYHIPENDNTPVSNHITSILEDRKSRIWIGTASEGLECFDKDFNKLVQYHTKNRNPYQLVSNKVSTLMEDDEGDVWVGLWSGRGFHIVNPDEGISKHFHLHKSSLRADWYHDFLQDSYGNIWIGIWGAQGLYRFDKHAGKFMNDRFISYLPHYKYPVPVLAHDGKNIWLTFKGQGRFFCLNPKTNQYRFYSQDHYSSFEFSEIADIYSDKKNKVWFQTNNGIYLKKELPYYSFSVVNESYMPSKNQLDHNELEKSTGTMVLCSILDDMGNSWIGTYHGLIKMQKGSADKIYRSSENGLISDTIWSLDYNSPGELWIGTNNGICMLDIQEDQFISFNNRKDVYLSSHLISFLFEDNNGFIWVGTTHNGVNRLNTKTAHIDQYLSNPQDSNAFWGTEASCIHQDSRGVIWIGGNGLNVFDPSTGRFSHVTESDGLSDNEVCCILEDKFGFLWISTKYGLSKLNVADMTCENFFEKDGLPDNEFSRAGFKLENGLLLFGSKNGISIIDPENMHQDGLPPNIALTDFKIFDKTYDFNLDGSGSLNLEYDQNYFSFEFAALDFSDPFKHICIQTRRF